MNINEISKKVVHGDVLPICNEIIDLYVNIYGIEKYRCFVNELEENNGYLKDIIERKRKDKYDSEVSLIDDNGLLNDYRCVYDLITDSGEKSEYFKKIYEQSSNYFYKMLIDRYFEDVPYNFLINLDMMLKFTESVDVSLIDGDRLRLYYLIYNFNDLSVQNKKSVYEYMNNGNDYVSLFYDDYRRCKDYAYSLYNDMVIKIDNMSKSSLSDKYGIPVYEIDGEDFMAFVHQTHVMRNDPFDYKIWNSLCDNDMTTSFSVIDQEHLDTIFFDTFVMLGFCDLDIDRIIHIYHSDSMSRKEKGSYRVNEIVKPDVLMDNTSCYNELLYMESNDMIRNNSDKHKDLMPSYILCYDNIYDNEIKASKEYGIPIVLVNTKKYIRNRIRVLDLKPDNYRDKSDFVI